MDDRKLLGNLKNLRIITAVNFSVNVLVNVLILSDANLDNLIRVFPIYSENIKLDKIMFYLISNILVMMMALMDESRFNGFYSRKKKKLFKREYLKYFYLEMFFVFYVLWACFVKKQEIYIEASIYLAISYLPLIITFIKFKEFQDKDNRKIEWFKSVGEYDSEQDSFMWRFKIYFGERNKQIQRADILKSSFSWLVIRVVFVALIFNSFEFFRNDDLYNLIMEIKAIEISNLSMELIVCLVLSVITIIFLLQLIFFVIEVVFNLNTKFIGVCTEATGYYDSDRNRYSYTYVITDRKNKRKIKICEDRDMYNKGETAMITHTVFNKIVIKNYKKYF